MEIIVERRTNQLSQSLLTQQILDEIGFDKSTKGRYTTALSSQILDHNTEGKQELTTWNYRSIGKLNYLKMSTKLHLA